jgi:hypothetical protein
MHRLCRARLLLRRRSAVVRSALPAGFFVSRDRYIHIYWLIRFSVSAFGIMVLLLRRPIARFAGRHPGTVVGVAISIVMAILTTEVVLRHRHVRAAEEVPRAMEPSRRLDPILGWVFVPSRVGYQRSRTRGVTEYAFDRNGYRGSAENRNRRSSDRLSLLRC